MARVEDVSPHDLRHRFGYDGGGEGVGVSVLHRLDYGGFVGSTEGECDLGIPERIDLV